MQRNESKQIPLEETPAEDTVTITLGEYQEMKEALEDLKERETQKSEEKRLLSA